MKKTKKPLSKVAKIALSVGIPCVSVLLVVVLLMACFGVFGPLTVVGTLAAWKYEQLSPQYGLGLNDSKWKDVVLNKEGNLYRIKGLPKEYLYYDLSGAIVYLYAGPQRLIKEKTAKEPLEQFPPKELWLQAASDLSGSYRTDTVKTTDKELIDLCLQFWREEKPEKWEKKTRDDLVCSISTIFLLEETSGLFWRVGEEDRIVVYREQGAYAYYITEGGDLNLGEPSLKFYHVNERMYSETYAPLRAALDRLLTP